MSDRLSASDAGSGGTTSSSPRTAWLGALRVVAPIWFGATALRYLAAAITEWFGRPDHGRLAQGLLGVLLLPSDFDSGYFKDIAVGGYFGRDRPEFPAFFPGYPLVMRSVALLTGGVTPTRVMIAGAFISAVLSLAAAVLLYRIVVESPLVRSGDSRTRAAAFACTIFLFWPTATFLSAAYSESLYLTLALGAWWNALRGRWWWAGLLCAGASLTRVNGVFLMVALLVLLLTQAVKRREWPTPGRIIAVLSGASGALAYLGWLWWRTGDPLAWSTAQRIGWARDFVGPWTAFTQTLDGIAMTPDPLRAAQWWIDMGAVLLLVLLTAFLVRHRLWPEAVLVFITLFVLATSSNYLSIMRNTLTVFPLFVVLGVLLGRARPVPAAAIVAISAVWMVGTTITFTLTLWSG